MKSINILVEDHRIILRALDVLDEMAEHIQNEQPVVEHDVLTLLRFLRAFADDHHQAREESALFPQLMRTSAESERLRQMIFEHDQERSLVEGLEESLRTKKGVDFVVFAKKLTLLIRTHIEKEDTVLFLMAERCLSSAQDERILSELHKFQIDSNLFDDLRRLEWTYLRRAA